MKKPIYNRIDVMRGVSTLDALGRNLRIFSLLLIFTIFSGAIYGGTGHSILDAVDPNFNVPIQTNSFSGKSISEIKVLSDDKILVSGNFNTYNGQPISKLVRLNADGSLDPTFNNNLLSPASSVPGILLLSDGKFIIASTNLILNGQTQPTKYLLRLNADGTIDPTFDYTIDGFGGMIVDSSGRIILAGSFSVMENGVSVSRSLIRLNADGTYDPTFKFQSNGSIDTLALQNNKIVVAGTVSSQFVVYRINEDGSADNSFPLTPIGNSFFREVIVQPDNKILVLTDYKLLRLNENGSTDAGFQIKNFPRMTREIHLSSNGKITASYGNTLALGVTFLRLMPDGTADPSFSVFTYTVFGLGASAVQADGSIIIGEENTSGFGAPFTSSGFIRLLPGGSVDTGFNPGGTGFFNINPGRVRSIVVQADNKILIAGEFDTVNGVLRSKIARLNSDGTLDTAFNINTGGAGNYFSRITEFRNVSQQADGKLVATGSFGYFVNGVEKSKIVRLNSDGSIDSSFIPFVDVIYLHGSNRFVFQNDGKIVVGTSHHSNNGVPVTFRFNANGALDTSFNSPTYTSLETASILDVAIQTDGKILIGGIHYIHDLININTARKSFLARLNIDGSIDQTFQMAEESNKAISTFKLLPNGKILIAKLESSLTTSQQSNIFRLNTDGSIDSSFNAGTGANGGTNALLILENGKIMIGGKFSTFSGQPRGNLALINADGSLDATTFNINQEVLCLTEDNQGRVLVGGGFTSISVDGGQNYMRSYVARLIDSAAQAAKRTRFDFDGDGKADISIFRPESGEWWYLRSSDGGNRVFSFGTSSDKIVPADYTGDGKTDIAFYRPSTGEWFVLRSEDSSYYAFPFGVAEDIPVPADYDGDGKVDPAVYRPSTSVWYILGSKDGLIIRQFGETGDLPLPGDYNGDGKTDLAVYKNQSGFKPVIGDYTGDGKDDVAFYDPATSRWGIQRSEDQTSFGVSFGAVGDIPAPADYDGDGKTDIAIYRPSTGEWWYQASSANGEARIRQFGISTDKPVPAAYIP